MSKENYLEKKPMLKTDIVYTVKDGIVTLEIENKGFMNRIFQKFFKKPKISYIHLDELGSFAISVANGEKTILDIGKEVKEEFGEKANPLYERLAKFFQIMDSYSFIKWE